MTLLHKKPFEIEILHATESDTYLAAANVNKESKMVMVEEKSFIFIVISYQVNAVGKCETTMVWEHWVYSVFV